MPGSCAVPTWGRAPVTDPNGSTGLVGQIIADRYRIDKKLGGGGMGEVYLGEHIRMQRKCAIKVLRVALSDDNDTLKRFELEAKNACLINHPNVAQVYDFGEHGTLPYLVMEFIEGQSLQDVLEKDDVMHPDVVADVIMQAASALEAAHAQHVLHRDVKPDNIMLAKATDGTYMVKLVDFGIARAMADNGPRVTQTGMVVGTPEYMSPEQIAGEPLDNRSDLYSLALVAFQALTGTGAFPDTGSMESLIHRLTSRPRTLIEVRSTVSWPPKLQTVFDRALAPQREERHASVVEFAGDLSGAIVTMSPSETQAFYRRALEARSINPVALTSSATPAQPSREKKRGKTDVSNEAKAPAPAAAPRYMGPPPRQTQVGYEGPGVKRTSPWRLMLFLAASFALVAYFDDKGVVAAKFNSWGVPAVTTAFNQIRVWTKKDSLKADIAVTPPDTTITPAKQKPRVTKTVTPAKRDSVKAPAQAVPPKPDSTSGTAAAAGATGTVPPPPPARE